jgi:hypothetical protein
MKTLLILFLALVAGAAGARQRRRLGAHFVAKSAADGYRISAE